MKKVYFLCLLIFYYESVLAQVQFNKTFDYLHGLEFGFSIQPINDSEYLILTGAGPDTISQEMTLVSGVKDDGDLIFQKPLEKPLHYLFAGSAGSMKLSKTGFYEFGGGSVDTISSNGWLVKMNENGDTVFTKSIGHDLSFETFYNSGIALNNDNLLIGIKCPQPGICNLYAVRTDSNGNLKWQKTFDVAPYDIGNTINEISGHRILIGADQWYSNDSILPWIIITDSLGNMVKEKVFNEHQYHVAGCYTAPTGNNDILWCGFEPYSYDPHLQQYTYNCIVSKLDSNFNIIWQTVYTAPETTFPYSFKQLPDSSIVVVGFKTSANQGLLYGWIAKLNKKGKRVWERKYTYGDSRFFNYFSDFQKTRDGGYIICGSTDGDVNQDLWVVKLDSTGCLYPGSCDQIATGTIEVSDVKTEMRIFPNPAADFAQIEYSIPLQDHEGRLSVFTLSGEELLSKIIKSDQHQTNLNLENFASGVYLLQLRTSKQIITKKLVKR